MTLCDSSRHIKSYSLRSNIRKKKTATRYGVRRFHFIPGIPNVVGTRARTLYLCQSPFRWTTQRVYCRSIVCMNIGLGSLICSLLPVYCVRVHRIKPLVPGLVMDRWAGPGRAGRNILKMRWAAPGRAATHHLEISWAELGRGPWDGSSTWAVPPYP